VPIAIIPCCHVSLKDYICDSSAQELFSGNCSRYVDLIRQKKLLQNGFEVHYDTIASMNTPKNRIIVALPYRKIELS